MPYKPKPSSYRHAIPVDDERRLGYGWYDYETFAISREQSPSALLGWRCRGSQKKLKTVDLGHALRNQGVDLLEYYQIPIQTVSQEEQDY